MNTQELNKVVNDALKTKEKLKNILELEPAKWLIGYELVKALKKSIYAGNTIDEDTFHGVPYLIDYKSKDTIFMAVKNPL